MSDTLATAERALRAVEGADGAVARVVAERSLFMRFADSRPTQATSVADATVEIAVVRDGHVGRAGTNRTDADGLAATARTAQAIAETAARASGPGGYPGLPELAAARTHAGFDPETAQLDPARGGEALAEAFRACKERGVGAHGVWTVGEVQTSIVSSHGHSAVDRTSDAYMKVTAIAPSGRSGYAAGTGVKASSVDPRALAERAATRAAFGGEPRRLPPGDYPVVLEAAAVGELLEHLGAMTFNGLAYAEDRSAVCGRMGTQVTAPNINLADSPRHPRTLPRAFDAEGVAKNPLPLIQDGVAHRVVHDTRSAALAGARTTGHALVPGGSDYGPVPTNLVLTGGGAVDPAELCRPIERGVYVTRFWYTNPVRPKETLLTGLTRDGTFLIEDGRIVAPLADMRMTDRVLGLLERTEDLTADPVLWSEGEFYGRRFATGVVCPALRASALRFTA